MNENDILICCDESFNVDRVNEYIDQLNMNTEYGILSFKTPYTEIQYTKKLILDTLQCKDTEHFHCSSTIMIKKNEHSTRFVQKWYIHCENYNLINSTTMNEDPRFIEPHHTQSILSVLLHQEGSILL